MSGLTWLRSLFAWETVREGPIYSYQRNTLTGRRRVVGGVRGGYAPRDDTWLRTGEWQVLRPPSGRGSGSRK